MTIKNAALAAMTLALAAVPAAAQITELNSTQPAPPPPAAPGVPGLPGQSTVIRPNGDICLPSSIAKGRDIVVLSANRGAGGNVPFSIGTSDQAPTLLTVTGGRGRDTVLILSGSSSILWDVRGVAKGRIKAILAHGVSAQAVVGAGDAQTEFLDSRSMQRSYSSSGTCAPIVRAGDISQLKALQKGIVARFGVTPTRLYAGSNPAVIDIDGATVTPPEKVDVRPQDVKAAEPIDSSSLLPGLAGMQQLVEQGYARPVPIQTVQQLKAGGARFAPDTSGAIAIPPEYANLAPEIRQRLVEARNQQMQAYAEPRAGFVLVRSVTALPRAFQPSPMMALIVPDGITFPSIAGTRPTATFVYRVSGVPLETLAALPSKPPLPENPYGGDRSEAATPVELAVTWQKDGLLVRFPDEKTPVPTEAASLAAGEPASNRLGPILWTVLALILVAAAIGGFLFIRRRAAGSPSARKPASPAQRDVPRADPDDEVTPLLTRLEAIVPPGPLLSSLSDLRHQVSRLSIRDDLDDDLLAECGELVDQKFVTIARRYAKARPTADPAAGGQLDDALKTALADISARLAEIHEMQNARNVEAIGNPSPPSPPMPEA